MSNFVINRIQRQRPVNFFVPNQPVVNTYVPSPPVESEELFKLLISAMTPQTSKVVGQINEIDFGNIFDFVNWYSEKRSEFSETQQQALDTLIQTRDMVYKGCNCKQQQREHAASEYFKTFWVNNFHTDMMPALLNATKANKVKIGNFLAYPAEIH